MNPNSYAQMFQRPVGSPEMRQPGFNGGMLQPPQFQPHPYMMPPQVAPGGVMTAPPVAQGGMPPQGMPPNAIAGLMNRQPYMRSAM